ncbi:MAG TPA: hypothetical protein VNA11_10920, partial [Pseudonocardia sp.]|nr:hypothetical protein [Pseudonocardia sp.]
DNTPRTAVVASSIVLWVVVLWVVVLWVVVLWVLVLAMGVSYRAGLGEPVFGHRCVPASPARLIAPTSGRSR